MARVDSCPETLIEVVEAATKLRCGVDQYKNSRYLCLPTSNKTSLVEFCYGGIMGLQPKGNCLQTFNGNLTLSSCLSFSSGCPETHFISSEFYKYPACQKLDWKHRCYLMDPSCTTKIEETDNHSPVLYGPVAGCILLIIIAVICFLLWRRRKQRRGKQSYHDAEMATERQRNVEEKLLPEGKQDEEGVKHIKDENAFVPETDTPEEIKADRLENSYLVEEYLIRQSKEREENVRNTGKQDEKGNAFVPESDTPEEIKENLLENSYLDEDSLIRRFKEKEENVTNTDILNKTTILSTDKYTWIAAIDFGTSYSGYAVGKKDYLEKDPLRAFVPAWKAGAELVSFKTPTTVLLDENEQLHKFGYDAETTYAELTETENKEHEGYFYFRRFKMTLSDKVRTSKLTVDTKISDIRGREVKAVTVFSHAIRYLKNHLLSLLEKNCISVRDEDILWILTVPTIWNPMARLFMRKAAEKAGIPGYQLKIALEAEAAFIYCQHLPIEKLKGSNSISEFKPGSKYLVLDAGGGTIDITVHEVTGNGRLKELHSSSGGDWGGTSVNTAFREALEEIVTKKVVEDYCHKYTGDYIELFRYFELKKRKCGKENDFYPVTLRVPVTFTNECSKTCGGDLDTLTASTRFKEQLLWTSDKVRIDIQTFEGFFQPACTKIIDHVEELFKSPKVKDVKKILMVGGFSESRLLQKAIRGAFPDCSVIVPYEAGLAILRGAILFGHKPDIIESRISKYTFGVRMTEIFAPRKHMESKKEKNQGVEYCKDIFDQLVKKGDELRTDEAQVERSYILLNPQQRQVFIDIYISKEEYPRCMDHWKKFARCSAAVPEGNENDRLVTLKMVFGRTELMAQVTVNKDNLTPDVFQLPED